MGGNDQTIVGAAQSLKCWWM